MRKEAFPCENDANVNETMGMELRDYFAAKVLAGMITTSAGPTLLGFDGAEHAMSKAAYKMADAMIKAREVA